MIVRLGVWCDYVTDGEYRAELVRSARSAGAAGDPDSRGPDSRGPGSGAAVPSAFPGPGSPAQIRARIDDAVADFARSANFTVHEFAETDGGRRIPLGERGFAIGVGPGVPDPWPHLRPEDVERDARELFWMDEADGAEDHCEDISGRLRAHGIRVTAADLRRLPYQVRLSDRLRSRLSRQP